MTIVGNEFVTVIVGEIVAQIGDLVHLVERVGRVGIGGEDVGRGGRADLALCRGDDVGLKVVDAALAGAFHGDAVLLAGGGVELVDERTERFELLAVIIGPHRDGDRLFGRGGGGGLVAAAGEQRERRRTGEKEGEELFAFHGEVLSVPVCAGRSFYYIM